MVAFDFPRTLRDARPHTLSRISDGDTPDIDQSVRMVSIDSAETVEGSSHQKPSGGCRGAGI